MGIDRIAMLKYGIPDLRAFFDSDLRWLRHYGFAALDVPTLHGGSEPVTAPREVAASLPRGRFLNALRADASVLSIFGKMKLHRDGS